MAREEKPGKPKASATAKYKPFQPLSPVINIAAPGAKTVSDLKAATGTATTPGPQPPANWGTTAAASGTGYAPTASSGSSGSSGEKATGWASRYQPDQLYNMYYTSPELLARDVLQSLGYTDANQLSGDMGDKVKLAASIYAMLNGNTTDMNSQTDANIVNYAADYIKNLMTPGGAMPQIDQLLQNLLWSGDKSVLGSGLQLGDANTDVGTLLSFLQNAVQGTGLTPFAQRVMMGSATDMGDQFLLDQAKGKRAGQEFRDYFRNRFQFG